MGGGCEVESRLMHVEKLRPAIGFPREIRPKAGTFDAVHRHLSMSLPGHMESDNCE